MEKRLYAIQIDLALAVVRRIVGGLSFTTKSDYKTVATTGVFTFVIAKKRTKKDNPNAALTLQSILFSGLALNSLLSSSASIYSKNNTLYLLRTQ